MGNNHVAAEEARELASHGQTEAGAARVAPQRVVRLPEGLEEVALIAGGDATARVRNLEVNLQRSAEPFDPHNQ